MRQGAGAVLHRNSVRPIERHFGYKFFLKHFISDDKIGDDLVFIARHDVRFLAPGQKFGVMLDFRNEIEHLRRTIGQKASFLMLGHVTRYNMVALSAFRRPRFFQLLEILARVMR